MQCALQRLLCTTATCIQVRVSHNYSTSLSSTRKGAIAITSIAFTYVAQSCVDTLNPVQLTGLQETKNSRKDFLLQATKQALPHKISSSTKEHNRNMALKKIAANGLRSPAARLKISRQGCWAISAATHRQRVYHRVLGRTCLWKQRSMTLCHS